MQKLTPPPTAARRWLHPAHNAEDASDEELADDIAYLRKAWGAIRAQARASRRHAAARGPEPAQRVLRDLANESTQSIASTASSSTTR